MYCLWLPLLMTSIGALSDERRTTQLDVNVVVELHYHTQRPAAGTAFNNLSSWLVFF